MTQRMLREKVTRRIYQKRPVSRAAIIGSPGKSLPFRMWGNDWSDFLFPGFLLLRIFIVGVIQMDAYRAFLKSIADIQDVLGLDL